MNRGLNRRSILISIVIVLLISLHTLAEDVVVANAGDCNVRTGPNIETDSIGVLYRGESASYANETETDERGVDWYKIQWNGTEGWVSTRYTDLLTNGEIVETYKEVNDRIKPGEYVGLYGYSACLNAETERIKIIGSDGTLVVSCDYKLKADDTGFLSACSGKNDRFAFYPAVCNGEDVILYYENGEFVDMMVFTE